MSLSQVIPFSAYSPLSRGNLAPWCQDPFCSGGDVCPPPQLISCGPWHTLCSARLSMLVLFLLHVFAHAAPSYWNALAPTSSLANSFQLVLQHSAQVLRPSCVLSMICQYLPPQETSLPEIPVSTSLSISLADSDFLRAGTGGHHTLPLPHTMRGTLQVPSKPCWMDELIKHYDGLNGCVLTKFVCWNCNPQMVFDSISGRALGRWLGHKGGAVMNGISALIKGTPRMPSCSLSTTWEPSEKKAGYEPGTGSSTDIKSCQHLDLGLHSLCNYEK